MGFMAGKNTNLFAYVPKKQYLCRRKGFNRCFVQTTEIANGMNTYEPHPLDTSGVRLSDELTGLTERLAENVHDVWSAGRIADGWQWGEKRDDARKLHPCLVPYDQLPESEKAYDRNTAMETIKTILQLGYTIEKK